MKINWIEEAKEYLNFLEIEDIEIKTKESLVSKIIWGMVDELEVDNDILTNGYIELKVKEIEQEIDRAREEVLKELIKEYEVFDKKYNMNKTEELKHMITKLTK